MCSHLAAREGHLPVIQFLLSNAATSALVLEAINDRGETPKMVAQQFLKQSVVHYIEKAEWARENGGFFDGTHDSESHLNAVGFPAHDAAFKGDLNQLRVLIENGVVKVNERDEYGSTPLHKVRQITSLNLAAGQGHIDCIQWLLQFGANSNILSDAGESPKDVAHRFGQLAALHLLSPDVDERESHLDAVGESPVLDLATELCSEYEDIDVTLLKGVLPFGDTEGQPIRLTDKQKMEARGKLSLLTNSLLPHSKYKISTGFNIG
ncbi:unnamed protein product [Protopolystoma xenopodis]|uniref:Uncharacterized protein n=1 Tax=Protopolystoma xenopodis TaxID=117903 RepID=A0A3S4ZB98_9PLAT|nr:unnamed protein product [Protopolystoma xenopodis]